MNSIAMTTVNGEGYQIINIKNKKKKSPKKALQDKNQVHRCDSISTAYRKISSKFIEPYKNDLLKAIAEGDTSTCRELLTNYTDIDKCDEYYGVSALYVAAERNNSEVLQLLLDKGADVNVESAFGSYPIHIAIRRKSFTCCNILLNLENINVLLPDVKNNFYPLHLACDSGNEDICKKILEIDTQKVTLNEKNATLNQTPLHIAAQKDFKIIVDLLLEYGAEWNVTDTDSFIPLHLAARNGHTDCIESLLDKDPEKRKEQLNISHRDGFTALILAAQQGHSQSCQKLEDSEINAKDKFGSTALHYAAKKGFFQTISTLINLGADILIQDKEKNTPLHKAANLKKVDCLKLLNEKLPNGIPQNLEKNHKNQTLLHIAANTGIDPLEYLLSFDCYCSSINTLDGNHQSPLYLAVKRGSSNCSEVLLEHGADPFQKDLDGNLPLHIAAGKNSKLICQILLRGSYRVSINHVNNDGATALHLAAMRNAKDCCSVLIDKNPFLFNTVDKYGKSPFHIAASRGYVDVLNYLIKAGVKLSSVVDTTGDSPLHLACSEGHFECCQIIVQRSKESLAFVNKMGKRPMDIAFKNGKDDIFDLFLNNLPNLKQEKKMMEDIQKSMHGYMQEALKEGRKRIVECIIKSSWYVPCFDRNICSEDVCFNFRKLIEMYPELAERIFDYCVIKKEKSTVYNFEYLEDVFFCSDKSVSPFEAKTGKLKSDAKEGRNWVTEHPFHYIIKGENLNLLLHELTNSYLKHKWNSYVCLIFFILLFMEFFSVIILSVNLHVSWNCKQMEKNNITFLNETLTADKYYWSRFGISLMQILFFFCHFFLEFHCIKELTWELE